MSTNKDVTILALVFAGLGLVSFTFWINQGRLSLKNRYYFVFIIISSDMFSYTGLAEVDMTKVTVALCYSGLTKVTTGHVLGTVIGIHLSDESENIERCTYCFLNYTLFEMEIHFLIINLLIQHEYSS